MTFRLILLKSKTIAVRVNIFKYMMILMSFKPPFFPVEGNWFRTYRA